MRPARRCRSEHEDAWKVIPVVSAAMCPARA